MTAYTITSNDATKFGGWWPYALVTPTDTSLMTGSGTWAGKPCNSRCVVSMTIGFYKKNRICRGWLCCARQRQCLGCMLTTSSGCPALGTPGNRCNP